VQYWEDFEDFPHGKDQGWIGYQQRWQGDFFALQDLHEFPYDIQTATLRMDSLQWTSDQCVFLPAKKDSEWLSDLTSPSSYGPFNVIGWNFLGSDIKYGIRHFDVYDLDYATMLVHIDLKRDPSFYLNKLVGGAILLTYMSMLFFVLVAEDANRMMGALTVFLALISFVFVATSFLPELPYQTRIDNFFSWSFFLVFLMLFTHAIMYMYRADDDDDDVLAKAEGAPEQSLEMKAYKDKPQDTSIPTKKVEDIELTYNCLGCLAWKSLGWQRRIDILILVLMFLAYNIGVLSILGRIVPIKFAQDEVLGPYPSPLFGNITSYPPPNGTYVLNLP